MNSRLQRKISLFLSVLLITSVLAPIGQAYADTSSTPASILDERSSEIGPGASYHKYSMKDVNGFQKAAVVEFDPKNPALELQPGLTNHKVFGMTGVSKMATDADQPGNKVIAAINGDFYDMSNGVPLGFFMGDGRILISPPADWNAFAIKEDGSTMYSRSPQLTRTITIDGVSSSITHINRPRGNDSLNLYTFDYNTSTDTNNLGDEVVLNMISGDIKSGHTMVLEVAQIHKDKGNTPLAAGQVILSASGTARQLLSGLEVGDQVTASFQLSSGWEDVTMAIGGSTILVVDGEVQPNGDKTLAPRTAIGTKADGKIILFEIDGRQPGYSEGVTLQQLGQLMKDMGVVNALNLDGGGSSTMVIRPAGETARKVVNSPSDGSERSTANGLLLVNKAAEGPATALVVKPNLERVLAGTTSVTFSAAGVDANLHPASISDAPVWSVDSSIGTIDPVTGQLTASLSPGTGTITAAAGGISGTAQIEVVDQLTELRFPHELKTFESGKSEKLSVMALRDGQIIQADNKLLQWSADPAIGTIDADGVFTAANGTDLSGKITVSYKGISTSMDANVGVPPVILEDFENGLDKYKTTEGANYVKSVASIESTNEEFIRFGNGALKLDYDFIGKSGTSGAYLQTKDSSMNIQIPGYPEKISMWVYGDGNKHWLRAQLRDPKGTIPIDFTDEKTGVDFKGWRYLEATVPKGRTLPLSMDMPVRYMEPSAAKKDAGTIYVDQIRALYGPANDDLDPPVIKNISPAEGLTVKNNKPVISVNAEDYGYDHAQNPGNTLIDPASIRMYVDGIRVQHTLYPPEGRIHYTPTVPLADGVHQVKVQVKDLSGNQTTKQWTFQVDTGAAKIEYTTPTTLYAGETYAVDITAKNASVIKNASLSLAFDPKLVNSLQVIAGDKLTDGQLNSEVDEANGIATIQLSQLSSSALTDQDILAHIQYRVKPEAEGTHTLSFKSGSIEFTNAGETVFPFFGLPIRSDIKNKLQLTWNKDGIVQGYLTEFKVSDEQGQPVEEAKIIADGAEIGSTDAQGILTTDALTKTPKKYQLQAKLGSAYSRVETFTVSGHAGAPIPSNVVVTMGQDPSTSRGFTWQTNPTTIGSVVEIEKQSEFTGFNSPQTLQFTGSSSLYSTQDLGTVRVHKAAAAGLEPGTAYMYRVGDGNGNYSVQGTFQTDSRTDEPFKFLFFADSQATDQAGYNLWGNTVKTAVAEHPDAQFMLHIGDMVDSGFKEAEWNMWFNAAQQELMNTTFVAAIGNHEAMQNGNSDFNAHFNQPGNGLDSLKGSNFSFDYEDAHFVVLNSEGQLQEQAEWLKADLANNDKSWKIAFFHRGPYGSIYDSDTVRNYWAPILEAGGVDLVLNGHDHIYLRNQMKDGQKVEQGKGTTYVVGGSTGPKFYSLTNRPWIDIYDEEKTQMYSSVEINGDQLNFITKTVGGRVVDQFTLHKKDAPLPTEVIMDQPQVTLGVGESAQLQATVLPIETADKSLTWSVVDSSPEAAVMVSQDGLVTALHEGTAVVRATSVVDSVYGESTIHVTADSVILPEMVNIHSKDSSLYTGQSMQLTAEVLPEQAYSKDVTWSIQNDSVAGAASISENGLLTALRPGTVMVRATSVVESVYGERTFTIKDVPVVDPEPPLPTEVIMDQPQVTLGVGESAQLQATVLPIETVDKSLTWSVVDSSPEAAVMVSQDGLVTALHEGTAVVRATSVVDSVYGESTIHVTAGSVILPEMVNIHSKDSSLYTGQSMQLTAEVLPEQAYSKDVTWSIQNDSVAGAASISESGLLTALRPGTVTVRATSVVESVYGERTFTIKAVPVVDPGSSDPIVKPPAENEDTLVITSDQLRESIQNGMAILYIDKPVQFIQLPSDAASILNGKSLQIVMQQIKLTIPYSLISDPANKGILTLSYKEAAAEGTKKQVDKLARETHAELRAAGQLFSIQLTRAVEGGASQEVVAYKPSMKIELAVDSSINPKLAGVYEILTDGELRYIGGTVSDSKIVANIDHPGNYVVLEYNKHYSDIPAGFWAEDVIKELSAKQLVKGVSSTAFAPTATVTRAEFISMLVRVLGLEGHGTAGFTDVPETAWYADAIYAAAEAGIVNGVSATLFKPEASITREEMAVMLVRAYEYATEQSVQAAPGANGFKDLHKASSWSQEAIAGASALGLLKGRSEGVFAPKGIATRAESVQVAYNLLSKLSLFGNNLGK